MAENKKGFLLYANYIGTINQLPDEVAGRLFKHIFAYVNDLNPVSDELLLNVVFEPIKNHLKDDLEKYILGKHDKSLSGRIGNLKRWHKDLYDDFAADKLNLQEAETIAQNRKVSHRDVSPSQHIANIAVIDIVKDKAIVNDKVKAIVKVKDSFELEETKEYVAFEELKIPPNSPKIDFMKLQKYFNDNRGMLPEVKKMSDARKKRILVLEKQYGKDLILTCINKTRDSPFLQGENKANWIASFDWIFTPANFLKIIEDNYEKRINTSGKTNEQIFVDAMQSETAKNFRFK